MKEKDQKKFLDFIFPSVVLFGSWLIIEELEEKPKDNNPGGGLFCNCGALLYPDPDKDGWHKCKKCGKSSKIRGKRIIISRAKLYKERKIEEGRQ